MSKLLVTLGVLIIIHLRGIVNEIVRSPLSIMQHTLKRFANEIQESEYTKSIPDNWFAANARAKYSTGVVHVNLSHSVDHVETDIFSGCFLCISKNGGMSSERDFQQQQNNSRATASKTMNFFARRVV